MMMWSAFDVRLHNVDCRELLPTLEDASIDSIVTDPPYSLEFMGKDWDKAGGAAEDMDTWRAVYRVLKPGGHLVAFGGTRTYHRLACAIEDAGFEIRDSLHWLYGSGFPKGKACLKPAHEPLVLARKPSKRSDPLPGLDACRVGTDNMRESRMTQSPGGVLNMNGRDVEHGNWKQKPNDSPAEHIGRWPPNILLTHAIDCQRVGTRQVCSAGWRITDTAPSTGAVYGDDARDRTGPHYADADGLETVTAYACAPGCPVSGLDAQSGTRTTSLRKKQYDTPATNQVYSDLTRSRANPDNTYGDSGGASRFYPQLDWSPEYDLPFLYQAKAPKSERPHIDGQNSHPTVKPLALMRWLVRLVTPVNGVVLDPFCGTGTTLQAARMEGFKSIGCDNWDDAITLAKVRLGFTAPEGGLF